MDKAPKLEKSTPIRTRNTSTLVKPKTVTKPYFPVPIKIKEEIIFIEDDEPPPNEEVKKEDYDIIFLSDDDDSVPSQLNVSSSSQKKLVCPLCSAVHATAVEHGLHYIRNHTDGSLTVNAQKKILK